MDFKKIEEMWNTGKFDIVQGKIYGEANKVLTLLCQTASCEICPHSKQEVYGDINCEYDCVFSRDVEMYLLKNKPKEVINRVRLLPEDDYKYWITKLQENFPIDKFPEYYI